MERQSYKIYINEKYGLNFINKINKFQQFYKDIEVLNQDIDFLSKCKRSGVVPIHCRIGGRRSASPTTKNILKASEKKLLNRSIVKNYSKRWKKQQEIKKVDLILEEKLSLTDYVKLQKLTEKKHSKSIAKK